MNNSEWNNQNNFNGNANNMSFNQGYSNNNFDNKSNKNDNKKIGIIIIVCVLIVILFTMFKIFGNKNNLSKDNNDNINNQIIDNNSNNDGTPNGTTIELGDTLKIRNANGNYDLKFVLFEPNVKITYESGITRMYAYLTATIINNSNEDDVRFNSIGIYDDNNNEISASCVAMTSKDSEAEQVTSVKPNETRDLYFQCYLKSEYENSVAVKAVFIDTEITYEYVNGEFLENEKEFTYYINLN